MGCCRCSLLQREYFRSAVNMVTNSHKTSDITKRDIFPFVVLRSYEKYDKSAAMQFSAGLRLFSMFAVQRHSESRVFRRYLITCFADHNFRYTLPARVIFKISRI